LKGVIHLLLYHIVYGINLLGTLTKLQAPSQYLDSQMVFLINHGSKRFPLSNNNPSGPFAECVMPTDKVALHHEVPVKNTGLVNTDVRDFAAKVQ
jgi:hypothetical protein